MPVSSFNADLARKEWGWRKFGRACGVSVLLTRGRWMGVSLKFYDWSWRGGTTIFDFGFGQFWVRLVKVRSTLRDWPGRPTRAQELAPRSMRERVGARVARSLLWRWECELRAETLRADAGWEETVNARASDRSLVGAQPEEDSEVGALRQRAPETREGGNA